MINIRKHTTVGRINAYNMAVIGICLLYTSRELTEKDLETFRLDSPVVREILANLNQEVAEGIRQKEKKGDD